MISRTVVITGATRGIGRAIALKLAAEGYRIVLNYCRNDDDAQRALAQCRERTGGVMLAKADVADVEQVQRMMDAAAEAFGTVDVLINNAGLNIDKPFLELSERDWNRVVETNMRGVFVCCRAVVPMMLAQERGGVIVNVGATTAISGRKNGLNYCASKAAVLTMTKCLALELAPKIRVNCLVPGLVETEEARERFHLDRPSERRLRETGIPLGYVGDVEDVAAAASYLISPAARYMNGQKLIVDGGQYMY